MSLRNYLILVLSNTVNVRYCLNYGKTTKKKLKEIKQDWAILNFDELPKPLYWNDTLEGWVSSRDNESALLGKKSVINVYIHILRQKK